MSLQSTSSSDHGNTVGTTPQRNTSQPGPNELGSYRPVNEPISDTRRTRRSDPLPLQSTSSSDHDNTVRTTPQRNTSQPGPNEPRPANEPSSYRPANEPISDTRDNPLPVPLPVSGPSALSLGMLLLAMAVMTWVLLSWIGPVSSTVVSFVGAATRHLSLSSSENEWQRGVSLEHIRVVQHAEMVLLQQRDALMHWRLRHYGTIAPALERYERLIANLHNKTEKVICYQESGGTGGGAEGHDVPALMERLKIVNLVDGLSEYVNALEHAAAANSDEPREGLGSADCSVLEREGQGGLDLHLECLLQKVNTSVERIWSLQNFMTNVTFHDADGTTEEVLPDGSPSQVTLGGINVRISIDDDSAPVTPAATEAEDVRFIDLSEVDVLLQTKFAKAANEVLRFTLPATDTQDSVKSYLLDALDEELLAQSEEGQGHLSRALKYLKARANADVGAVQEEPIAGDVEVAHSLAGGEGDTAMEVDDGNITVVTVSEEVSDEVKFAVEGAIRDVLHNTSAVRGGEEERRTVQEVVEEAFREAASSRRNRFLQSEEMARAAQYAQGHLDIGDLLGEQGDISDVETRSEGQGAVERPEDIKEGTVDLSKFADYAVAPRGGKAFVHPSNTPVSISKRSDIVTYYQLTTSPYKASASTISSLLFYSGMDMSQSEPNVVLNHHMPPALGHCYAFPGSVGNITVLLHSPVHVYGVGIYHLPLPDSMPGSPDSAPKRIAVYGWATKPTVQGVLPGRKKVVTGEAHFLGEFVYARPTGEGDPVDALQKFVVSRSSWDGVDDAIPPLSAVTFAVLDNHGNSEFTCMYRLQVLGELSVTY